MGRLARFIRFYTEEDDGNGGEKGVLKTVTGAIIHILDALKKPINKFTATLSPVQDLHGQDAPYPAGGGKNKLNISESAMTSSGYNRMFPITLSEGTYTLSIQNAFGSSKHGKVSLFDSNGTTILQIAESYSFGGTDLTPKTFALTSEQASSVDRIVFLFIDSGTTYSDIAVAKLMIESGSSATAYAPYSNICPITGHTGANVVRTGKLYDTYTEGTVTPTNFSGVVETLPKHRIKIKGTTTGQVDKYLSQAFNGMGGTLELNVSQPMPYANSRFYIYDTTSSKSVFNLYGTTGTSGTFETVSGHSYRLGFLCPSSGYSFDMDFTATITDVSPITIPITFPDAAGTVYGCTLTLEDGVWKLRVTMARTAPTTLKNGAYQFEGTYYPWIDISSLKSINFSSGFCNKLASITNAAQLGVKHSFVIRDTHIDFSPEGHGYADSTSARSAGASFIENGDVEFIYPLATPIEYTLTESQALTLLKGENNIWVDNSDDLELQYYAKAEETP